MMKVVDVRTHLMSIPHLKDYRWAIGSPRGTNNVLVEVETEDGIIGYGDACGTRSAEAVDATIRSVRRYVIGQDAFRSQLIMATLYRKGNWSNQRRFANQAFAGIEMALWDACGKALGQPVHRLLGGKYHESIHWFGFVQGGTPHALADHAKRLTDQGFDILYMKIGIRDDIDLLSVASVREAIGDGVRLRLDVNEAWTRTQAIRMSRQLEPFNIDWIEQPLVFWDFEGAARLRSMSPIPTTLDQSIFTHYDVLRMIRENASDVLVLGFHETGGLLQLRNAAAVADAAGISLNRHAVLGESGLSTLAALHVLSTIPNLADGNQIMSGLFEQDVLVDGQVEITNARTPVPDQPGLGAQINWDSVGRFKRLYMEVGQYPM